MSNIETESGELPKRSVKTQRREGEAGGAARSDHLNCSAVSFSEIICRRHFVVESMRRRAGERGGWRERNIQTEGNVSGGGGGEGKDI